ncbi:hypothetical protein J5226_07150 [Lysobacter sp. K5869]|uniref:hypothetical protein n=1 Tax=Lysobacter sp. K5869 TaxID=2820808 RepID=UPI001C05EF39|nr:hypothetical protein [Lysobacter sp. K5869]QWP78166.1 hypothetical protein J5226_07150 [Lysobacter sp. K5869]
MLFIPERIKNSRAALVLHLFVAQVLAAAVCAADVRFRDAYHFGNALPGESAGRCDGAWVRRGIFQKRGWGSGWGN